MLKNFLKNKNVKDSILYTGGNYFFRISLLISNLISSNILGPSITGVITYINAIDQNLNIAYSTLRSSIERETPKLNANGSIKESNKFISHSFFFSYILFFLGSIYYSILYLTSNDKYIKITCLFFIFINFLKALSDLLRIYHKSLSNFSSITLTLFIVSLLQPLIVLYMVNEYLYVGFLWTRIILYGISVILFVILLKKYPKLNIDFDINYFKKIFLTGLPIVIFGLIMTLIMTIDKFFIRTSLGDSMLGYYSIGALIFQVLLVLPESLYGSYFPKFITYKGDQIEQIDKLSSIIRVIILPAIFITWVFIPIFINIFLPKFITGILAAKILILSVYFAASYQMYYYEIVRLNKYKNLIIGSIVLLTFSCIIYTISNYFLNTIEEYAFLNVLIFLFFSFLVIAIALNEMGKGKKIIVKKLTSELIKITPLIPILIIDMYHTYSVKIELIKFVFFTILYLPIFLFSKKEIKTYFLKKND